MTTLAQEAQEMHALKEAAEEIGRTKKAADQAFKEKMYSVLARMEFEEAESLRTNGVLYTAIHDRMKGQVDDRSVFVRWALEQDDGIQEFLERYDDGGHFERDFYAAVMGTEIVTYKENGTACNSMAKAHVDDDAPLPPGLSFRPDPYIQQRAS